MKSKKNAYNKYLIYFFKFNITLIILSSYLLKNNNIPLIDKISVIIPTYNRANSIISSIKSVLSQTYRNLELIVVDDCSNDNTESLISNIKDNRLLYIKLKERKGANYARNIGISKATGKYISFQDSDDLYRINKLEKQYKNLIKKKSDFDFCKICLHFNSSNKIVFPRKYHEKKIKRNKIKEALCNGNFISTQSILINATLIKRNLFDINMPRFQDYDLMLRIVPICKTSYTNITLADLYRQKDSISHSDKKLKKACSIMLNKEYNLTKTQKEELDKTLLYWFSKQEIENLTDQINTLNKANLELNEKYNEISTDYNRVINKYLSLQEQYTKLMNSKRIRLLTKLMKLIGK